MFEYADNKTGDTTLQPIPKSYFSTDPTKTKNKPADAIDISSILTAGETYTVENRGMLDIGAGSSLSTTSVTVYINDVNVGLLSKQISSSTLHIRLIVTVGDQVRVSDGKKISTARISPFVVQ